jgi:repressor LexA
MHPKTRRQKDILDYIRRFMETRGHKPSYAEIAKHFSLASKGAVARHIASLEKQGFLSRRTADGSFNLNINSPESAKALVTSVEWVETDVELVDIEDPANEPLYVSVFTLGILKPEKVAAYRMRNDSMLGDHICEGDIVLLERRGLARDGEIVLALVERRQFVLKRYFRNGASIELRPSNATFETISVPHSLVEIKGVYKGLVRPLS